LGTLTEKRSIWPLVLGYIACAWKFPESGHEKFLASKAGYQQFR
jgi:hypothetical protein